MYSIRWQRNYRRLHRCSFGSVIGTQARAIKDLAKCGILVRAGMLTVPSCDQPRLPQLTAHDIVEIDVEVRAALVETVNVERG
jgi:hypothetical protein